MVISNDYLSNLKFEAIQNLLRIDNVRVSRMDISLIGNDIYVELDKKISPIYYTILKNYNRGIEIMIKNLLGNKAPHGEIVQSFVNIVLSNIINYNFLSAKFLDFIKYFENIKWKQTTIFGFYEILADLFLTIMNEELFNEYSFNIASLLCFCLPLINKLFPVLIRYKHKKECDDLIKSNKVEDLAIFFKKIHDEEELRYIELEKG